MDNTSKVANTQDEFFRVTDQIPGAVWYWAAVVSIVVAATLKFMGKDHWALFVGQWPPAFLLFGLYHKLFRPEELTQDSELVSPRR